VSIFLAACLGVEGVKFVRRASDIGEENHAF
jgi:hypothetical protein